MMSFMDLGTFRAAHSALAFLLALSASRRRSHDRIPQSEPRAHLRPHGQHDFREGHECGLRALMIGTALPMTLRRLRLPCAAFAAYLALFVPCERAEATVIERIVAVVGD